MSIASPGEIQVCALAAVKHRSSDLVVIFLVPLRLTNLQHLPTGTADFGALDALKTTSSSSSCTSVLQAAMMVPDLSTFVTTAQVCCRHAYLFCLHDSLISPSHQEFCVMSFCFDHLQTQA